MNPKVIKPFNVILAEHMLPSLKLGIEWRLANDKTEHWGSFAVSEPPQNPLRAITVYLTGGDKPDSFISTRELGQRHPAFQVRVRCRDYTEGSVMINTLVKKLRAVDCLLVAGIRIQSIDVVGEPVNLPQDNSQRNVWVCNFKGHWSET